MAVLPRRLSFLASATFVLALLAFLWLPFLQTYGGVLRDIALREPARLLEALPLSRLPRTLFLNTTILSTLTAALAVAFGIPTGLFLASASPAGRFRVLAVLAFLLCVVPLAIPPTLGATAYLEITRTPPARSLASLAADQPLAFNSIFVAAPVLALCFFPVVAFPVFAARRAISHEMEEAALLFGNEWSAWRGVLWPLLAPAVYGAAGIVAALAMWEMGAPDLIDVRTYSVQIYRDFSAQNNIAKAALDAAPMLLLGCVMLAPAVWAMRFYSSLHTPSIEQSLATRSTFERAGAWATPFVLLASPIAFLAVFISQLPQWPRVLQVCIDNAPQIINTATLATIGAFSIVLAALLIVSLWRSWPAPAQRVVLLLTIIPLLFAPIMLAIALIQFWNRPAFALIYGGIPETGYAPLAWLQENITRLAMPLITYAARFLPLAVLLLHEAARRVDDVWLEAARGLGASGARTLVTILVPLLRPALLGTFALLWSLCASELTMSVLVYQPGGDALPLPIFNLMHIGSTAEVAVLSLVLAGMSSGVLAGVLLLITGREFWKNDE